MTSTKLRSRLLSVVYFDVIFVWDSCCTAAIGRESIIISPFNGRELFLLTQTIGKWQRARNVINRLSRYLNLLNIHRTQMKWIEFFFSRNIFWIFFCIFPHNFCFVHCFGVPRKGQIVFCFFLEEHTDGKKNSRKKRERKVKSSSSSPLLHNICRKKKII